MADKLQEIISLIFMMRQLSHENISKKNENFSFLQFITLRFIRDKKPLMKEVADFLAITPPSATSLVKTLSEADLVSRLAEKDDRRIVRIVITKKGENILNKWQKKVADNMRKRLEHLSQKEQNDLMKILTKLSQISNN